ncbi:MAG TPA: hypothetical protein VLE97_05765 [Gaiellaceae bacterium]|nr:hypothetical protein [Gaiellaceae bacterium]
MHRSKSIRPKSPRLLDREIASALSKPRRSHATSSSGDAGMLHMFTYRNKHGAYSNVWARDGEHAKQVVRERGDAPGSFFSISRVTNVPPRPAGSAHARVRAGHASKKAAKSGSKERSKTSDKINIDQLAQMLGLPDWEKIDEMNQQHYWEMTRRGDYEDEDAQMKAEEEARDEVYGKWYDAVEHAASRLFEEHGLELQPAGKWHPSTYTKTRAEARPHELKIVPSNSWDDAAEKIRATMSGIGDVYVGDDLREFLRIQGTTARQAVLSHLGAIKRYPHVYGGPGAHQMYEQHWR